MVSSQGQVTGHRPRVNGITCLISLKISEISDWKYQDGKKLVGGYTIRYFVEKMSPKERENFLKEAGFEL